MRVAIKHFKGDFAIVEMPDKTMVNLPKILIPCSKEGDVIDISKDDNETEILRKKIEKLINDLA